MNTKNGDHSGFCWKLPLIEKLGTSAGVIALLGEGLEGQSPLVKIKFQYLYDHLECIKCIHSSNAHTIYKGKFLLIKRRKYDIMGKFSLEEKCPNLELSCPRLILDKSLQFIKLSA